MILHGRRDLVYLRFNSISRFSAECDRLVPPVPKTLLTFVRTKSRAVSVSLYFIRSWRKAFDLFGTEKETIDQINWDLIASDFRFQV